MNVLVVKNNLPYPFLCGQDLVDYGMIKALAQKYEVTLVSPCRSREHMEEALPELKNFCSEIKTIPLNDNQSLQAKISWRLKREYDFWLRGWPLEVSDLQNRRFRQMVAEAAAARKYEFAEIAFWTMGGYAKEIKPHCPVFLLQHDSNYLNFMRQKTGLQNRRITVRMRSWYTEKAGLLDYEKNACREIDWVFFISSADLKGVQDEFGIAEKASSIPVPYIIEPAHIGGTQAAGGNILFLGGMQTPYNINSILTFKHHILPRVKEEIPNIMLTVVGNLPDPVVAEECASAHIQFIGFQPDLNEVFSKYQALIAPVWIGTGIKTKIIEGIGRGMPIISTPLGVEGIDLTPGSDFLLAASNEEFAAKLILLLKDAGLRKTIGGHAYETYLSKFSFERTWPRTLSAYDEALKIVQSRRKFD